MRVKFEYTLEINSDNLEDYWVVYENEDYFCTESIFYLNGEEIRDEALIKELNDTLESDLTDSLWSELFELSLSNILDYGVVTVEYENN